MFSCSSHTGSILQSNGAHDVMLYARSLDRRIISTPKSSLTRDRSTHFTSTFTCNRGGFLPSLELARVKAWAHYAVCCVSEHQTLLVTIYLSPCRATAHSNPHKACPASLFSCLRRLHQFYPHNAPDSPATSSRQRWRTSL